LGAQAFTPQRLNLNNDRSGLDSAAAIDRGSLRHDSGQTTTVGWIKVPFEISLGLYFNLKGSRTNIGGPKRFLQKTD
jgi:hypothetical protein